MRGSASLATGRIGSLADPRRPWFRKNPHRRGMGPLAGLRINATNRRAAIATSRLSLRLRLMPVTSWWVTAKGRGRGPAPAGASERFPPIYESSKRRLTWPNGAIATLYNGTEPDQLRGPEHDGAWVDELAKFALAQDV